MTAVNSRSYITPVHCENQFCISHAEVERLAKRSDRVGAKLLDDCDKIIENRNSLAHDLSVEIWRKEMETLRRRELGYRRWHTQIYMPMNDRLADYASPNWVAEQRKLRKERGDEFVKHSHTGHVFLDVESPAHYCGHKLNGAITRLASSAKRERIASRDRTMSAVLERTTEERALMLCTTPGLVQATTDDIDEILRPGSKDFRVRDSRDWQRYIDRDISSRHRNHSSKQLKSTFKIGNEDMAPIVEHRAETRA